LNGVTFQTAFKRDAGAPATTRRNPRLAIPTAGYLTSRYRVQAAASAALGQPVGQKMSQEYIQDPDEEIFHSLVTSLGIARSLWGCAVSEANTLWSASRASGSGSRPSPDAQAKISSSSR